MKCIDKTSGGNDSSYIKGIFSNSNSIILCHESEDIYKKASKISVDSNMLTSYAQLWVFHCSIHYCVELIIVRDVCENCSHIILK